MLDKAKKIFFFIIFIIQLFIYAGVFYLEKLTHSSAGVNHHLYYQKTQYMNGIFKDMNLMILSVFILIIIVLLIIQIIKIKKGKNKYLLISSIIALLWSVNLEIIFFSKTAKEALNYPYLLMALIIIVFLSIINIINTRNIKNINNNI